MVDDTADGKDNMEKKTREVTDIRMYHLEFSSTRMWYAVVMLVDIKVFLYIFDMDNNIKNMTVGGLRQCRRQIQPGGEDQGGRW